MQVGKRLVIYIQDFDPRGLKEYYNFFQREFSRACTLHNLTGNVGAPRESAKRSTAEWDVTTSGDGWQVETRMMFLRWDDIIATDLARPPWWKIVQKYRSFGVAMLNGVFRRILRANWRYGLLNFMPLVLVTAWIFLGCFFGLLCMDFLGRLGAPSIVAKIVGAVTGIGGFASLLMLTEPLTKLLRRCDEAATTDQLINRKRKDIDARMATFAAGVTDAVRKSDADEVVIVGHGLGAALAIDVLGRALIQEPNLGEDSPRVALLTLGANLPAVGFDPEAGWFRNRLRQIAVDANIDWIDIQSRDDALNFCPFDPVAGHDIVLEADERRNPHVVALKFGNLWKPGYSALRRLRLFAAHFQYLRANERPDAAYDFYLICYGPLDLMTRLIKA